MHSVIRRGPWSFNDFMCVTQKWTPLHSDKDLQHIPFWVQISGIPIHFLTLRLVREIGMNLGNFIETDFEGDNAIMVDYVRVKLWWNVNTPLRFQRIVKFGVQETVLKFRYEKLRNFCNVCGLMTHEANECPSHIKTDPEENDDGGDEDGGDEDGDDIPPGFNNEQRTDGGLVPFGTGETKEPDDADKQAGPKKRKTKASPSNTTEQPQLVCYEMKQGYTTDNAHESFSKRRRIQTEIMEIRNWFKPQMDEEEVKESNTHSTSLGEGSVGQKPPGSK